MKKIVLYLFTIFLIYSCKKEISSTSNNNSSNAQWESLGKGLSGGLFGNATAYTIAVYKDELYVGGRFTAAGNDSAYYIAKWNGTNWSNLGTGKSAANLKGINSLIVYDNALYALGNFNITGGTPVLGCAKWDGLAWSQAIGIGPIYNSFLTVYNGELYLKSTNDLIYKYDVTTASSYFAQNLNGPVNSVAEFNGSLYIAGSFNNSNHDSAFYIARWDGSTMYSFGEGIDSSIYNLFAYDGSLYASGEFTHVGGITCDGFAKWNGSSWSPVAGYNNNSGLFSIIYNGELYENFITGTPQTPELNLVKWDGSTWSDKGVMTDYGFGYTYGTLGMNLINDDLHFAVFRGS